MNTLEAIFTRRSIRKYTSEKIADEIVEKLLKAGMSAPSAGNQQPWHFIVINDRNILNTIPTFHQYAKMLLEAPLAIVVCGDLELEKFKGYWVQDCSAAIQNILLAAHDIGLGAVWIGIYPNEERVKTLKELLKIPQNVIPLGIISLGYPNETHLPADRFNKDRVHYNYW